VQFARIIAAAAIAVGGTVALAAPAHAAGTSKVSVVHGIPNTPVDVYVNGKKTLDNFAPATVAGPLDLPAGSYDIALTKPGDPPTSPVFEVKGAKVPADANISLVAHLTGDGKPTITPFANDTAKLPAGKARLTVRHTAAAPAVDVRAGGKPAFPNLTNPNEAKADLDAGTVNADVVLAGTSTVALGPVDVPLAEGASTIVYAIGSANDKTLAAVTQKITGLHSAPAGVPSGTGGLAATGVSAWWYAVVGLGLLLAGAGIAVRRRVPVRP
jgi:LPXTG-motif cell wall-anchored protein